MIQVQSAAATMIADKFVLQPNPEARRRKVNHELSPERKIALGQFMTPSPIAEFMASMFDDASVPVALVDAGAGIGSLTVAAAMRLGSVASVDAWEVDPTMRKHLEEILGELGIPHSVHGEDFIPAAVRQLFLAKGQRFTHAILNPPYKKLNSDSVHRALLGSALFVR